MTRLVAFTGPAGAGKSTAAQALVDQGWVRVKFADPLKNMLRAFYASCGINNADYIEARIEGDQKEEPDPLLRGRTPRHAMQTLGTEWGRNCVAQDLWVSAWTQQAGTYLDMGVSVVVDDCRFDNEAAAVRKLGGLVVGIVGRGKVLPGAHASESGLTPDFSILNDADQTGFERRVIYTLDRTDF